MVEINSFAGSPHTFLFANSCHLDGRLVLYQTWMPGNVHPTGAPGTAHGEAFEMRNFII